MVEKQRLYSVNRLANELKRNQRTVSRALDGVAPDGELARGPGWLLSTAIAAMRKYEAGSNRFDVPLSADDEAGPPAIAAAVDAVTDLVARMRSEESVERRRELLQTEGKRVGRLHDLIQGDLAARGPEFPTIYG